MTGGSYGGWKGAVDENRAIVVPDNEWLIVLNKKNEFEPSEFGSRIKEGRQREGCEKGTKSSQGSRKSIEDTSHLEDGNRSLP